MGLFLFPAGVFRSESPVYCLKRAVFFSVNVETAKPMMKNRKIRNPPLLSPKSPSSSPPYKFSRSPDDRSKQQQHMNGEDLFCFLDLFRISWMGGSVG